MQRRSKKAEFLAKGHRVLEMFTQLDKQQRDQLGARHVYRTKSLP